MAVHIQVLGLDSIKELPAPCVAVAPNCAVYSLNPHIFPEESGVVGLGVA
jgi:hypothetical protein